MRERQCSQRLPRHTEEGDGDMRSAILLVGLVIADALGWNPSDRAAIFYVIMLFLFMFMDLISFSKEGKP